MDADKICTAMFNALYKLTVTKAGTGSGTVTSTPAGINCGADCQEPYNSGTVVTLKATPATGSRFGGWSGDADCSDGKVTLTANRSCTATFTTLSAQSGVSSADHHWQAVALPSPFADPVVILGPPSDHDRQAGVARSPDPAPGEVRIRNVTPTALELGFQPWNERDRPERIFYLVAEDGPFTLAGLQGEARQVTTSPGAPAGLERPFSQPFDTAPALFTAVI